MNLYEQLLANSIKKQNTVNKKILKRPKLSS